tara:strand:- start:14509 stop:16302 length:1794 start_codon:yes stop_codon:yes gene_type:complete
MFELAKFIGEGTLKFYVLAVVLLTIFLLYKEIYNTAIIFLLSIALLLVPNIITTFDVLSSFANEQVAIIVMLLIIGQFLKRSPVIENLFQGLFMKRKSYFSFTSRLTGFVALFSGFMNNTPLVALLLPYVVDWGRKNNVSPSKLLIPLSYAAIMGGGLTLIGTATNLIANSILVQREGEAAALGMFSFFPVGAPLVIVGLVYILMFGRKFLPNNIGILSNFNENQREYLVDLKVGAQSSLIGKTIGAANLRALNGLYLVEIVRPDKIRTAPGPEEIMRAGDYLIFAGETDKIVDIVNANLGLEMPNELEKLKTKKEVVEVIVPYNSSLSKKKIKDSNFRAKFDAAIIAVRRDGEKLFGKIGEMHLKKGDMMLCVAGHDFYKRIGQTNDLTLVSNVRQLQDLGGNKSVLLIVATVLSILFPALGFVSLFQSLLLLFVFLLSTKTILFGEVKRAININLIVVMGGALSIGIAMDKSGAANFIADNGVSVLAPYGAIGILAGIYIITNLLAAYMTNIAAVSIILPIAISTAKSYGFDLLPFVLCVAFAGSKSFITPIGYQTNLMVYGPGGYSFKDFFKFGLPLTILFMVTTLTMINILYL